MATREIVVDAPAYDHAPVDTSVVIPDSVKRAADKANSFYTPPAGENPPLQPQVVAPVVPDPAPAAAAPVVPDPPAIPPDDGTADWHHRYLSMEGRYKASQRTVGEMQEQMSQLGDELVRTQQLVSAAPRRADAPPTRSEPLAPLLTDKDKETYGPELIDLMQRAARDAVAPDLATVRQETTAVNQRVAKQTKSVLADQLTGLMPNWREIDRSPRFKNWLSLPDLYSGAVRVKLLNAAIQAGQASRVIAFYQGFLTEEAATGALDPDPPPVDPATNPARQPAVPLETFAAPGKARPASSQQTPADTPIITRADIADFYAKVRSGFFVGREQEKARQEAWIFAAQNSGRVRG